MPNEGFVDKLLQNPAVRNLVDQALESATDSFNKRLEQMGQKMERYLTAFVAAQAQQQAAASRPQPAKIDPRIILGFGPNDVLTKDIIKARQRFLAAEYHPDKGGSTEAMQRVNDAAEELLKSVA